MTDPDKPAHDSRAPENQAPENRALENSGDEKSAPATSVPVDDAAQSGTPAGPDELRRATRAEVDAEGLPDENTVSKAAVYLNRKLPRTRTITQGLVRDAEGRVMLCQLSYKKFWDLPGGVVDPHESPAHALVREIAEELGATATITGLRVVSWLPPWRGWDDAMLYLFDVELDRPADEFALQRKEIAGIHFVGLDELDDHVAAYTAKVIRRAVTAIENGESGVYLENGDEPGWA